MSAVANITARIAELNDVFRTSFIGGRVFITQGVRALGATFESDCVEAVQRFRDFTSDNDPYGQRDFGAVTIAAKKVFWKIDYYDRACVYGSEDPSDPKQTTRVLTIMLAMEY